MTAPPTGTFFSNRIMGTVSVILFVALALSLMWLLVFVVQPLTRTAPVTDRIVETLLPKLESQSEADQETVRLLMSLENSATGMRLAVLQVAVATLGGFFLIVVGVLLFAAGASGTFSADAKGEGFAMSLRDLTPGIATALIGGVLIGIGAYREVGSPAINYKRSPPKEEAPPGPTIRTSDFEIPADSPYFERAPQRGDGGGADGFTL